MEQQSQCNKRSQSGDERTKKLQKALKENLLRRKIPQKGGQ